MKAPLTLATAVLMAGVFVVAALLFGLMFVEVSATLLELMARNYGGLT